MHAYTHAVISFAYEPLNWEKPRTNPSLVCHSLIAYLTESVDELTRVAPWESREPSTTAAETDGR